MPEAVSTEGTSLWNLQTQKPEWVPLDQVKARLSSGAYKSYAGSQVPVQQGIGGEASLSPEAAATAVAAGATPTHSESARDLESRNKQWSDQYDNAGDKALAYVDGLVSGLSGQLLEGVPRLDAYGKLTSEKNREENPGYKGLGELSALAASIAAPESLIKYTPLGASNTLFSGVSKGVGTALGAGTTKLGTLAKGAVSDAVGGAAAAAALSTAHAVGQVVRGKPVSGGAVIDDIGLGAIIGGGIGVLGAGLGLATGKTAKAIEAAARFDQSAVQIRGVLSDVSKSWHSAHNVAGARVEALDDLVKSGALDAELPGTEWLKARTSAKAEADKARDALHKLAGTDNPTEVAARLHDLAKSGKAKEVEKLYKAFDDYGTAVSHLDDVMQPTTFDQAHLHDVIGDTDMIIPASEHPMQRLEQMIENGSPPEEIERFAKQIDENWNREKGAAGPNDATLDVVPAKGTPKQTAAVRGGRKVEARDLEAERFQPPKFEPPAAREGQQPRDFVTEGTALPHAYEAPGTSTRLRPGLDNATNEDLAKSLLLGGSVPGSDVAGFQAKKILDQARVERATGVMSPARPTELGTKIQGLIDELTAATGNRLGSVEARALATSLGMNHAKLGGPVASKLADLWALHRMTEALSNTVTPKGKQSLLQKALSWGTVSGTGSLAYDAGGPFVAGAARTVARHMLGTALAGAAGITAVAGRFRQSAVNGLAKALRPGIRNPVAVAAIAKTVATSYEPGAAPTTDYETKAKQLRQLRINPEPVIAHLRETLKPLSGLDPQAYAAAVEAGTERLKNLAKALPNSTSISVFVKSKGPSPSEIAAFHTYEAVTADRELVFKYLKAGMMPESVIEAMNEQHPDFMSELREYVLNNPEEVQAASHNTQMALSKLLGVPLVPEADPLYVRRMQEPYIEAKKKAVQKQMATQGAGAVQPPPMTPAQLLVIPRMN